MFNRVAFVTGASRGIGPGRAVGVARGRAVFVGGAAATSIEENREFAEEMRALGGDPMAVNLDLRSPESVKEAFTRAIKAKGRVDVLVNNAGITRDGLAVRMKQAD